MITVNDEIRGRTIGAHEAVTAATRTYLRGEPLDMSALAADLGIGRATLYRWVGNREDLLTLVLAEGTELTFRAAIKGANGQGVPLIIDCLRRFMSSVLTTPALRALTTREPMMFLRLAVMPGAIEGRATAMVGELLAREETSGRIRLILPAMTMAQAIVRICDSHLYAHLLGHKGPETEIALQLVSMLLNAPQHTSVSLPETGRPLTTA
jgi:AcrR family transcriptional regulator